MTGVATPAHGTVTLNADGSFTYTPAANYNGADSFTYTANDGTADSNVATVTITVTRGQRRAGGGRRRGDDGRGHARSAASRAGQRHRRRRHDADGERWSRPPAHGTVTLTPDGSFTYTPAANYNGADSFTYTATDGTADSNVATVTITVTRGQRRAGGGRTTRRRRRRTRRSAATVLGNDTDVDGGTTLTASLVATAGARHGDAERRRQLHLHAGGELQRADSFTYTANDGTAGLERRDGDDHGHARSTTRRWRWTMRRRRRRTRRSAVDVLANDTDVDGTTPAGEG